HRVPALAQEHERPREGGVVVHALAGNLRSRVDHRHDVSTLTSNFEVTMIYAVTMKTIAPGDPGYARVRSTYARGGAPGLVLQPRTTAEVVEALAIARAHPTLPLGIRSGGHGISGRSTN